MIASIEDLKATACGFCGKEKEGGSVIVQFAGEQGTSSLCWTCLKKHINFRKGQSNPNGKPVIATPLFDKQEQ